MKLYSKLSRESIYGDMMVEDSSEYDETIYIRPLIGKMIRGKFLGLFWINIKYISYQKFDIY